MSAEAMMAGEFVTTAQMGEKWQVTIPKRYRDALKLETGATAVAPRLGAGLLLIP
jgi:bifunctional DNA-binding transcriptional regulator/antitoxin component of YhaV-PrlF toxin-antitoxin module